MVPDRVCEPPNLITSNVNAVEGDVLVACTYVASIAPEHYARLAAGRAAFSFCPELHSCDILGLKLCTILRLGRVKSLVVVFKDGSPHSIQIPFMVQEAAENAGFDKSLISYWTLEKGELHSVSDFAVRMARHFHEVEAMIETCRLYKLVKRLRADNGCPTDRAETLPSIAGHLVEEADETREAIEQGETAAIVDELGDVLFNILLACSVGVESGGFNLNDIARTSYEKAWRRHRHILES